MLPDTRGKTRPLVSNKNIPSFWRENAPWGWARKGGQKGAGSSRPWSRWGGSSPAPPRRLLPPQPGHPASPATLTRPSVIAWSPQGSGRRGSVGGAGGVLSQASQATRARGCGNEDGETAETPAPSPNSPCQARRPPLQSEETAPARPPLPLAGAGPRVPAPTFGGWAVGAAPSVAAHPELGVDGEGPTRVAPASCKFAGLGRPRLILEKC